MNARTSALNLIINTKSKLVRVAYGTKHKPDVPIAINSTIDFPQILGEKINIAIQMSPSTVDIDVDAAPDMRLYITSALDYFLPACPHIWGRPSSPASHRIYSLGSEVFTDEQAAFLARVKNLRNLRVEIRGGKDFGEYTMLPTSVHTSSEVYEWQNEALAASPPTVISPNDLVTGLRLALAASLIVPHWIAGQRQNLSLCVSGVLARLMQSENSFLTYELANQFLSGVMRLANDDQADFTARLAAFQSTLSKLGEGRPVTSGIRLTEITGDKLLSGSLYHLLSTSKEAAEMEFFTDRFFIWRGPALVVDTNALTEGANQYLSTKSEFIGSYAEKKIFIDKKSYNMAELFFKSAAAVRINGVIFEPNKPKLLEQPNNLKLNLWAGLGVKAYDGAVSYADLKPLMQYLENVLAKNDIVVLDWLLAWIANMLQHPEKRPGTAIVLVGAQGAGKSVLGSAILRPLIGDHNYAVTHSVENITKQFNVSFANKILIQCDEALSSKQRAAAAKLKAIISDPFQTVEPKGVDPYKTSNYARLLFTSNEIDDAIFISDGISERRYTVLEVSDVYSKAHLDFWIPFFDWLERPDTLPKIMRFFMDFKYDFATIKEPLFTKAKVNMQRHAWGLFDSWLRAMIGRNHPLAESSHTKWYHAPVELDVGGKFDHSINRSEWPEWINYTALVADYFAFVKMLGRVREADSLDELNVGTKLFALGLLPDDKSTKRLTVIDPDPEDMLNKTITKRVRIYTAPDKLLIQKYLAKKYSDAVFEDMPADEPNQQHLTKEEDAEDNDILPF